MAKIENVILDVQHMGKPSKPFDRGAFSEGFYECDFALKYAQYTREKFILAGYNTFLLTHGEYHERHEWVNKKFNPANSIYIACHINAGGGSYALIEHVYNCSEKTKSLAGLMAKHFQAKFFPSVLKHKAKIWSIEPEGRGFCCIGGVKMPALLFEPLFLDNPVHLNELKNNTSAISRVIFDSVEEYNANV